MTCSRLSAACCLLLLGCGRIRFGSDGDSRNEILVLGSKLSETLTDVPVLVRLPDVTLDQLDDLRFVAADQTTPLPYELERTDSSEIVSWVRIPVLAGDTTIWAYYSAGTDESPEAVWSSTFLGVWHLDDGHDSTAHHLDATFTGTETVDGVAGRARRLASGFATIANSPELATLGPMTWTAWSFLTSTPPPTSSILSRQHEGTGRDDMRLGPNGGLAMDGQVTLDPGAQNIEISDGTVVPNRWQLASLVYDGARLAIGIDGVTVATRPAAGTIHASPNPVWLGVGCNACGGVPDGDLFPGIIDEVRLEGVARSDAWLTAQYLSVTGALVIVRPGESL